MGQREAECLVVRQEGASSWTESYAGEKAAGLGDRETGQRIESQYPILL